MPDTPSYLRELLPMWTARPDARQVMFDAVARGASIEQALAAVVVYLVMTAPTTDDDEE